MAFIVEDGTGLSNANSLCDVVFANAYFTDRAVTAWTGTDVIKQANLIKATDFIVTRFDPFFKGERLQATQALSFPRLGTDEVPELVKKACCEYALRALTSALLPDPVIDETGVGLQLSRKKVGPIEKETRYQIAGSGATRTLIRPYPAADLLLRSFLKSDAGVIRG